MIRKWNIINIKKRLLSVWLIYKSNIGVVVCHKKENKVLKRNIYNAQRANDKADNERNKETYKQANEWTDETTKNTTNEPMNEPASEQTNKPKTYFKSDFLRYA